ncbi:hypothetical protein [Candidatus Hodgkinia cicadicola]|uniref:hypothetical protein n=1 Tax=Candidatus Hodgkinia cicadicola TaxID=573658 RepID=UPI001788CB1C
MMFSYQKQSLNCKGIEWVYVDTLQCFSYKIQTKIMTLMLHRIQTTFNLPGEWSSGVTTFLA